MSCVRRSVVLPGTRERVWEIVTEPDWLGDDRERRVEERVDERRIAWRWGGGDDESVVDVTLDDEGEEATRLTVTEIRIADLPAVPDTVPVGMRALALA